MTSTRGNWLRSLLAGLGIVGAAAAAPTVWAQGFGPDPFRPYNSQYDAYTYPMGPATPDAGGAAIPRSGVRSANQFQEYLNEIQGVGRAVSSTMASVCRTSAGPSTPISTRRETGNTGRTASRNVRLRIRSS